jgi:hypothetical protein
MLTLNLINLHDRREGFLILKLSSHELRLDILQIIASTTSLRAGSIPMTIGT